MDRVHPGERARFAVLVALAVLFWLALTGLLAVGTQGLGVASLLLVAAAYLWLRSARVSALRGNAVKVSADQLHDLQARVLGAARRLNVDAPPLYVVHGGAPADATATRFLGRDYLVLHSDLLDALEPMPGAIDFFIGRELGRLQHRHGQWDALLWPVSWLPLLGCAWRRAQEFTRDRYGLAACESAAYAKLAMAALATGPGRWKKFNIPMFEKQVGDSGSFWMSYHELTRDQPWLCKRMLAIEALADGLEASQPGRNPLAYLLAALTPRLPAATALKPAALVFGAAFVASVITLGAPVVRDIRASLQAAPADAAAAVAAPAPAGAR
jgi:hypothetical protein